MTNADILLIRNRFHTEVIQSYYPHIVCVYDNETKAPPDNGPWIRCSVVTGTSFQASLSAEKAFRHPFLLMAQIFNDAGEGDKSIHEIADAIVTAFRNKRASGIIYRVPYKTVVGRSRINEKWYQVNVTCPGYTGDLVKDL